MKFPKANGVGREGQWPAAGSRGKRRAVASCWVTWEEKGSGQLLGHVGREGQWPAAGSRGKRRAVASCWVTWEEVMVLCSINN